MKNTLHYLIISLLIIVAKVFISQMDINYPHVSQKESLDWFSLIPVLLLGCIGAFLIDKYLMSTNQPSLTFKHLKFILYGACIGLIFVFVDASVGFSKLLATQLNVDSIHLDFPASVPVYTIASVMVESIYHIIPIGILFWVISHLILKDKGRTYTFWILAVLCSLLEPVSQLIVFQNDLSILLLLGSLIFLFNLLLCYFMLKFGILSSIVTRWAFYMTWHVFIGPLFI